MIASGTMREDFHMVVETLPGARQPYLIRNGQGPRTLIGGMVASAYATAAETEGLFTLNMLSGGVDAGLPLIRHDNSFTSLCVLEGHLELTLDDRTCELTRGDIASVPPGTPYGFRMARNRVVVMAFQTGGQAGRLFAELGAPYDGFVQPALDAGTWADLAGATPQECDTRILARLPKDPANMRPGKLLPDGVEPYVLESGCGDQLLVGDQRFTFAGRNRQTGDGFLTLLNDGPAGDMIPPHKHMQHDEMFFCMDGGFRMLAGDEMIELAPGDWLFVPRGTPHAYQMLKPYNRSLGWLIPGVFEHFFETLGEPFDGTIYPQQPGPMHFDRVFAKLDQFDFVPLGAPPGSGGPGGPQA